MHATLLRACQCVIPLQIGKTCDIGNNCSWLPNANKIFKITHKCSSRILVRNAYCTHTNAFSFEFISFEQYVQYSIRKYALYSIRTAALGYIKSYAIKIFDNLCYAFITSSILMIIREQFFIQKGRCIAKQKRMCRVNKTVKQFKKYHQKWNNISYQRNILLFIQPVKWTGCFTNKIGTLTIQ